jgi:NAD(P)-dependent dehydrogenase (short-subunit alcohol dehydrogenase family)
VADRFGGTTAIVTGAGSGIGRAVALRLAAEGAAFVVAVDVDPGRVEAVVGELGGAGAGVVADVATAEGVAAIVERAGGRVDVLANVAGIMDGFLPVHEVDDETWDRVLAVNLTGPMQLTRAVLPLMLAAGRGAIVNVASEAALRGSCAGTAYTVSKHGLLGLTRSTAVLYGPSGIRCNAVCPGAVLTNIGGASRSEFGMGVLGKYFAAIPGVATPEELAATICWLGSDDASNVNGAVLAADGGWSAV